MFLTLVHIQALTFAPPLAHTPPQRGFTARNPFYPGLFPILKPSPYPIPNPNPFPSPNSVSNPDPNLNLNFIPT